MLFDAMFQVGNKCRNGHVVEIRPRCYIFFVLNSAEHEILNAHTYKNIKKFSFFSGLDKPRMLFFLRINAKRHFLIYEQEKIHAQLGCA